jgi:hypothetical protein
MKNQFTILVTFMAASLFLISGCSSMKTPATADVAVSTAAVESAASAGATEFAPVEMDTAREKLRLANAAMVSKDYELASKLSNEAQVNAKLAQSKAQSAKAQAAANAIQENIRVLREELMRANAIRK